MLFINAFVIYGEFTSYIGYAWLLLLATFHQEQPFPLRPKNVWPIRRNVNNLICQSDKTCDKYRVREQIATWLQKWFLQPASDLAAAEMAEVVCFVRVVR